MLYPVLRSQAKTLSLYTKKTFGQYQDLSPHSQIHLTSTLTLHFRQLISHLYVQLKWD